MAGAPRDLRVFYSTIPMNELITLDNLSRAKELIEIANVSQLKEIIARSEALKIYAAQAKKGLEIQNQVAEIKLRAEKRIGEMLKETPKHEGGRPSENRLQDVTGFQTLKDLGIEKIQSHRWQTIASLPDDQFEQYVSDVKKSNEELTTTGILRLARQVKSDKKKENNPVEFPKGKYQVIYADPPWDVKAGPEWGSGNSSRDLEYPTMSIQDISDIPVKEFADENAHLYLWTINKYIPETYEIVKAWGFTPSCLLTWCKPPHGIGLGGTFIQTTEYLLFSRRGNLPANKRIDTSWFQYPRGKHSEKPEEFRKLIEEVSPGNRLELFSRKVSPNWDVWGNEV